MRPWSKSWFVLAGVLAVLAEGMRRLAQIRLKSRHPPAAVTPYGCPLPPAVHRRVERVKPGRVIIVGDLHGCPELFRLLESLQYDAASDNLVLCGDLVNKGPASLAVLDAVPKLNCWAVRGNHDDAVLGSWLRFRNSSGSEPMNPKFAWAADMNEQQATVLAELPFTVSLLEYGIAVVHAGFVPGVPLEQQDPWAMYKMRNVIPEHQERMDGQGAGDAGLSGQAAAGSAVAEGAQVASPEAQATVPRTPAIRYRPVEKAKEGGEAWAALWRGPPHVFFGHDARRQLQLHPAATGLDTGCVYGGKLTAAVVPPLAELRARSPGFVEKLRAGRAVSREDLCVQLVEVQAAEAYSHPTTSPAPAQQKQQQPMQLAVGPLQVAEQVMVA